MEDNAYQTLDKLPYAKHKSKTNKFQMVGCDFYEVYRVGLYIVR